MSCFRLSKANWLLLLLVVAFLSGCGSNGGSISGTVFYNGKELEKGYISFTPKDGHGPTAGGPIANGKYDLKNLVPGPKLVHIAAEDTTAAGRGASDRGRKMEQMAAQMKAMREHAQNPSVPYLPEPEAGNDETVDIQPGPQTKDFRLEQKKQG
jgi:hypothetical protein